MISLPRLPSLLIDRHRLIEWLRGFSQIPVRIVLGEFGFGKTVLCTQYVIASNDVFLYIFLRHSTTSEAFFYQFGEVLHCAIRNFSDLINALEESDACQVVIDGIDNLEKDAEEILERLVFNLPKKIRLILVGRRTNLAVEELVIRGLAVSMSNHELLFTENEIAELIDVAGITATPNQVTAFYEDSAGWPLVVADTMRLFSEKRMPFTHAFETWRAERGNIFLKLPELDGRKNIENSAVYQIYHPTIEPVIARIFQGIDEDQEILETYSFHEKETNYKTQMWDYKRTIMIRTLGPFVLRNSSGKVSWIRRRDQQIIRYLLLQPNCSASRKEMLSCFWPEVEQSIAARNLRTACSTIRKALSQQFGMERAEYFFRTDGDRLQLDLRGVVVDFLRFKEHIYAAQTAEEVDENMLALSHYIAAERLVRGELFGGEPMEEWFLPQRAMVEDMLKFVRERILFLRSELQIGQGVVAE